MIPLTFLTRFISVKPVKKLIIIGVIMTAVSITMFLVYNHYSNMRQRIVDLEKETTLQEVDITNQQAVIDAQKDSIGAWKEIRRKMERQMEERERVSIQAESEKRWLNDAFANHDIEKLAKEDPVRLEALVNSIADNLNRMFECASCSNHNRCPSCNRETTTDTSSP